MGARQQRDEHHDQRCGELELGSDEGDVAAGERLHESDPETADDGTRGHTLEVRVSNHGAIRLYEELGFRPSGMRRGYYTDDREDALVMWRGEGPGDQPLVR